MEKLPKSWVLATIPEMISKEGLFNDGDWIESKDQDPKGDVRLIQLADIGVIEFRNRSARFLNKEKASQLNCTFLKKGDILVARMPDPLGRACIFPIDSINVTAVDVAIIRTGGDSVNHKWLMYIINSPDISKHINKLASGSTRQRISRKNLGTIPFLLPPLAEQKRIVAKLDKLFGHLETLKAKLDGIPTLIKNFRQAVLTQAVTGKLTEEWREGKELEEWETLELQLFSTIIVDCPHSTPKWTTSGKICVRTTEFSPNKLNLTSAKYVSNETFIERIKRLKPDYGDILYSREGTVGIACQVPKNTELCLGQRMLLIRTESLTKSKYLMYVLNSPLILNIVNKKIMGSTAPRINMKEIRKFNIPTPPDHEQKEIVERVKALFEKADKIEAQYKTLKEKIEKLPQAILAKAFKGELVEQLPTDGDAKDLLQEIKNAKEALAKPTKVKKLKPRINLSIAAEKKGEYGKKT